MGETLYFEVEKGAYTVISFVTMAKLPEHAIEVLEDRQAPQRDEWSPSSREARSSTGTASCAAWDH